MRWAVALLILVVLATILEGCTAVTIPFSVASSVRSEIKIIDLEERLTYIESIVIYGPDEDEWK